MKKRTAAALLAALLLLTLTACGKDKNPDAGKDPGAVNPNTGEENQPGAGTGTDGSATPDGTSDQEPVFPDSLAQSGAEVTVDDLISTLGLRETDLDTAMKDVSTVGDSVSGARTYRHRLLGQDADVSYAFDREGKISTVTIDPGEDALDRWRTQLSDTLRAQAVEGETDTWTYGESRIWMTEKGGKHVIILEKSRD